MIQIRDSIVFKMDSFAAGACKTVQFTISHMIECSEKLVLDNLMIVSNCEVELVLYAPARAKSCLNVSIFYIEVIADSKIVYM